jgi:hypothetical protein
MAKRKSERDPEELPDASDKRKQNDDDESGSDEVCAALFPQDFSPCADLQKKIARIWTWSM